MRLMRVVMGCALVVTATACSSSHSAAPGSPTTARLGSSLADPSATVPASTEPAAVADFGSIIALRIAHDIESSGRALGVGVDIEPWAPKIVAVVDVGGWNNAIAKPLQFAWSSVDATGAESALFDQTVDVMPGQRAFAVALSPGRLALGTYRVKVAIAGTTKGDGSSRSHTSRRGTMDFCSHRCEC